MKEIDESDLKATCELKISEKPYLSRTEAAKLLGISLPTFDRLPIPRCQVREGGRIVFSRSDIDAYLVSVKALPKAA